ncbi:MAG: M48 family metallopeptidase [Hyphomonadaceae bacterium]
MCQHDKLEIMEGSGSAIAIAKPGTLHRRDVVRGLWTGSMVLAAGGLAGCESAAEFFAPSDAELVPMAAEAWAQTKTETPISKDAAANRRLQSVGPKIALAAGRPNDDWEFVVFDTEEKNAFVLPGGKVGFYKGLLDFTDNDDQVAAVLGHEVAHVTRRHAALRYGQQQATSLGLSLGQMALGGTRMTEGQKDALMAVMGAGATVGIILPFSRDNESEADKFGVDYMHSAGYDVREAVHLWEKMGAASSSGRQPEWLSTHPDPATRVQDLRGYINNHGYATI